MYMMNSCILDLYKEYIYIRIYMLPSLLESFTCYLLFSFLLGDNVIVGSYDCRLCWFDLDLSTRPYRTLRYIYISVQCES